MLQPESALYFLDILNPVLFSQIHPPLLPLIMKFLFYVFGIHNYATIYMSVNIIFFIISLFFIYKIGEKINGISCGRISMILFSSVPAIYGLSRFYGRQDFHIISVLLMGIYFLIASDFFKNQKWTIFYAVSLGTGLLLRETFLGFAMPFLLFFIVLAISRGIKKSQICNLTIMAVISFVLYAFQFTQKLKFSLLYTPFMEQKNYETFFSKIHTIVGGLSENILALPLFLLLVFSIIFIFFRKKHKDTLIIMLLCGLIIPIIVALVIPHHKQQVYMVPLIPTIILLISTVVSYLKINIRRILLILFIAVSFLQYIELSYGAKIWFCDYKFKFNDKFSFKYFNKYDDNIMFYDIKKRAPYVALLEYLKYTENKKTLILAENYENADYVLQTLRAFILLNGFDNIIVNSSILNLYLPVYSRDLMHYKFIIDLRTYNDFNREYGDLSDNINEHKYINNFYIPTKDEFLNKYNSFWAMYDKTEYSNINIKNMKIYKLKDTAL
ncbi:MAG: glycosyltransferase family 39 protein [Endomicrobiaceae bacterium]|nr:glycosyltransferase family 39 protein [Endomicrobiaceae bacterium]MDD3729914.1 glycosyltransferase family 39 protein [Endomicrobiaceae bacterium]